MWFPEGSEILEYHGTRLTFSHTLLCAWKHDDAVCWDDKLTEMLATRNDVYILLFAEQEAGGSCKLLRFVWPLVFPVLFAIDEWNQSPVIRNQSLAMCASGGQNSSLIQTRSYSKWAKCGSNFIWAPTTLSFTFIANDWRIRKWVVLHPFSSLVLSKSPWAGPNHIKKVRHGP